MPVFARGLPPRCYLIIRWSRPAPAVGTAARETDLAVLPGKVILFQKSIVRFPQFKARKMAAKITYLHFFYNYIENY